MYEAAATHDTVAQWCYYGPKFLLLSTLSFLACQFCQLFNSGHSHKITARSDSKKCFFVHIHCKTETSLLQLRIYFLSLVSTRQTGILWPSPDQSWLIGKLHQMNHKITLKIGTEVLKEKKKKGYIRKKEDSSAFWAFWMLLYKSGKDRFRAIKMDEGRVVICGNCSN